VLHFGIHWKALQIPTLRSHTKPAMKKSLGSEEKNFNAPQVTYPGAAMFEDHWFTEQQTGSSWDEKWRT
jgi:hypothetical protein